MQFIDLSAQQNRIRDKIEANIRAVLDHGRYIMGPEVAGLEERLAGFVGVRHAVACSSGTDALLMALMAHGVKPGDAVFTSPFTFVATAEVVSLLGARPVFVDIDPDSYTIDPGALERAVAGLKHSRPGLAPAGVIAVDLFGLPADYDAIRAVAEAHGLFVIEDAAQSFGAVYKGRPAGSLADIACTSFFPAKPLGCYGDGGMCFTDDDRLAAALTSLRIHGKGGHKYDNVRIGINGRLDTLQAAVLNAKVDIFPEEVKLRNLAADHYHALFTSMTDLVRPVVPNGSVSVWAQYSLLAKSGALRDALLAGLKQRGIPAAVYYPRPLHLQPAFADLGYKEKDFPVSEDTAARIFSIPMHPYLACSEQDRVAAAIAETLAAQGG